MGVPAFFRWLTRKYPSVIVHCIEDKPREIDGVKVPVNTTETNPNGVEFDNLYLDMNGIIHPCTHPEDKPAPKNEEEMMIAIFECIDRIFRIVRPRKLLYMAIDGVAPRAKMNQQRSRRFRASKESYEKIKELERVRADLQAQGCILPPERPKGSHFDSNCITPGTPFMDRLSTCLHFYIHDRLNNDPGWKGIKIILSDANVPGEGEHKIMDYIRRQRAQPDHDPNTHHCLCGADADLIMLGLATHEPNFTIIREEFKPNKPRPCDMCGQLGHELKDCLGLTMEIPEDGGDPPPFASEVEFIFVRLNVLKEYLEKELDMPNLPFPFDLERALDDWVFMCFFVGNDFLPHLPSLEIRENAIDRLVTLYKKAVYKTGGWVTDSGFVNLNRVQLILSDLGEVEDQIFKNRQDSELRFKAKMKSQKKRRSYDANCYNRPSFVPQGQFAPMPGGYRPDAILNPKQEAIQMRQRNMHTQGQGSNKAAAEALKNFLRSDDDVQEIPSASSSASSSPAITPFSTPEVSPSPSPSLKRKAPDNDNSDSEEETNDEVRLWEDGFKDRYYESKFDVNPENIEFRNEVAKQYIIGLCWVLRYYYQGCVSWKWYFPYHYAPFASDFINVGDMVVEFEKNTIPFDPLQQLMGVFPAASRSHVPDPWAELMIDPNSSIIDFYPEDFQIDLNGKKFAWQGVALLPFVDEKRLKEALLPLASELTEQEVRRNKRGDDRLYIGKDHPGFEFLAGIYENEFDKDKDISIDPKLYSGMGGTILVSTDVVPQHGILASPIPDQVEDVVENKAICVRFRDLKYEADFIFPAKRLPKAKNPPCVLRPDNMSPEEFKNWRPTIGMVPGNQRASIDNSGHRTLSHYTGYDNSNNNRRGGGPDSGRSSHHQNNRFHPYNDGRQRGHAQNSGSSQWGSGGSSNAGYSYQGGAGGNWGGSSRSGGNSSWDNETNSVNGSGSGHWRGGGGNGGNFRGGNGRGHNSGSHYGGGGSGGYSTSRNQYSDGGNGGYGSSYRGSGGGYSTTSSNQDGRVDRNSGGRGRGERRQHESQGYYTSGYNNNSRY